MKSRILKIVFFVSIVVFLLAVPYVGAIELFGFSSWNVEWLAALEWTLPGAWAVLSLATPVALASGIYLRLTRPKEEHGKSFAMEVIGFFATIYVQLLIFGLIVWAGGGKTEFSDRLPIYAGLFLLIVALGPVVKGYLLWRAQRDVQNAVRKAIDSHAQTGDAHTSTTSTKEEHP
jgi:hypothetical protein